MSTSKCKVLFRELSGSADLTEVPKQHELFTGEVVWSRDGKRLYCSLGRSIEDYRQIILAGKIPNERNGYLAVDVATGKVARSPIPPRHTLLGERKDGSFVIVGYVRELRKVPGGALELNHPRLFVLSADGKEQTHVNVELPEETYLRSLSPSGNNVLSYSWNPATKRRDIAIIDLLTAKRTVLDISGLPEEEYYIWYLAWSPDGKRIAFTYELTNKEIPHTSCVGLVDADGKNFKEIRRVKVEYHQSIDWR